LYLKPPQRGSFLNEIVIFITENPTPSSIVAAAFYDFIKFLIGKAVGILAKPETPSVTRLNTVDEPFFDELGEAMEGPLLMDIE